MVLEQKRTLLKIGGMHCAGCINSIQRHVSTIEGVSKVEVNLVSEKAAVEDDPARVGIDEIEKAVRDVGYKVVYENISLKVEGITDSSDAQPPRTRPGKDGRGAHGVGELWQHASRHFIQ